MQQTDFYLLLSHILFTDVTAIDSDDDAGTGSASIGEYLP